MSNDNAETLILQPRVRQEQVLSPQLRASLRVLQMDKQTLLNEVKHEAEVNPVVELEGGDTMPSVSEAMQSAPSVTPGDTAAPQDEFDPEIYPTTDEAAVERRQRFFERQIAEESLFDHIMAQVPHAGFSKREAEIAELIIGDINEDGRYVGDFKELQQVFGGTEREFEKVLNAIQRFDPPGVGGRDLRECLLLQIEQQPNGDNVDDLRRLVSSYLPLLAKGKVRQIAAAMNLSIRKCEALVARLKMLEPKPGRQYQAHGRQIQFIRPELSIMTNGRSIELKLCNDDMPSIRINRFYEDMLDDGSTSTDTQAYLKERISSAMQLRDAITRREETILKVAEDVFSIQNDFLRNGFDTLKPLTIETVARHTGFHGTTVARAVNGKYVRTPRGTFELRKFFCVGKVKNEKSGTIVSSTSVKRKIAEIINGKGGNRMTDEKLMTALNRTGIRISRRTVAKYRAEIGIPAAGKSGRKRDRT